MDKIKNRWILLAALLLSVTALALWVDHRENTKVNKRQELDSFLHMQEPADTVAKSDAPAFFVGGSRNVV